jgi:hypothetical protein
MSKQDLNEDFIDPVLEYTPDPKWHRNISFVKSGFRILAGAALCFNAYISAGVLLILAEVLGVVEEIV